MRFAVWEVEEGNRPSTFATVIENLYETDTRSRGGRLQWFYLIFELVLLSFPGGMVVKSRRSGGATHNWRDRGEFRQRKK